MNARGSKIEVSQTKIHSPQFSSHLYRTKVAEHRKSSDKEGIWFLLYRTEIGSYLFPFHVYLTEIGSYLFWFVAYLFALGSYLFSSEEEETKKGKHRKQKGRLQNENGKTGILVPQASDESPETGNQKGKTGIFVPETGNQNPETGNEKGKTGNLVSGLPFFVPEGRNQNPEAPNKN